MYTSLPGAGRLREVGAPPLGPLVPLSLECKFPGVPSVETLLSLPLCRHPPSQALTSHCFPCSYEDPAALDGGEEGMDIIAHILALAPRLLKDSG